MRVCVSQNSLRLPSESLCCLQRASYKILLLIAVHFFCQLTLALHYFKCVKTKERIVFRLHYVIVSLELLLKEIVISHAVSIVSDDQRQLS